MQRAGSESRSRRGWRQQLVAGPPRFRDYQRLVEFDRLSWRPSLVILPPRGAGSCSHLLARRSERVARFTGSPTLTNWRSRVRLRGSSAAIGDGRCRRRLWRAASGPPAAPPYGGGHRAAPGARARRTRSSRLTLKSAIAVLDLVRTVVGAQQFGKFANQTAAMRSAYARRLDIFRILSARSAEPGAAPVASV